MTDPSKIKSSELFDLNKLCELSNEKREKRVEYLISNYPTVLLEMGFDINAPNSVKDFVDNYCKWRSDMIIILRDILKQIEKSEINVITFSDKREHLRKVEDRYKIITNLQSFLFKLGFIKKNPNGSNLNLEEYVNYFEDLFAVLEYQFHGDYYPMTDNNPLFVSNMEITIVNGKILFNGDEAFFDNYSKFFKDTSGQVIQEADFKKIEENLQVGLKIDHTRFQDALNYFGNLMQAKEQTRCTDCGFTFVKTEDMTKCPRCDQPFGGHGPRPSVADATTAIDEAEKTVDEFARREDDLSTNSSKKEVIFEKGYLKVLEIAKKESPPFVPPIPDKIYEAFNGEVSGREFKIINLEGGWTLDFMKKRDLFDRDWVITWKHKTNGTWAYVHKGRFKYQLWRYFKDIFLKGKSWDQINLFRMIKEANALKPDFAPDFPGDLSGFKRTERNDGITTKFDYWELLLYDNGVIGWFNSGSGNFNLKPDGMYFYNGLQSNGQWIRDLSRDDLNRYY